MISLRKLLPCGFVAVAWLCLVVPASAQVPFVVSLEAVHGSPDADFQEAYERNISWGVLVGLQLHPRVGAVAHFRSFAYTCINPVCSDDVEVASASSGVNFRLRPLVGLSADPWVEVGFALGNLTQSGTDTASLNLAFDAHARPGISPVVAAGVDWAVREGLRIGPYIRWERITTRFDTDDFSSPRDPKNRYNFDRTVSPDLRYGFGGQELDIDLLSFGVRVTVGPFQRSGQRVWGR